MRTHFFCAIFNGYELIEYCPIVVLSLGTYCPPREQRLLVSCSPVPHHVVPEGPLEGHSR